jgi:hypothetical protein
MKAMDYRATTLITLWMFAALMAAGAEPLSSRISTRMPACAELGDAPAAELIGYLEKDRKTLSNGCVEFAIRQLETVTDELPLADTERAIGALMAFLDFPGAMISKPKWYPAKNTIVAVTDSAVQRLWDAGKDSSRMQSRVLDQLVALIADTSASETAADSAAWAIDEIMAFPKAPEGPLPAVTELVRTAKATADASSSKRLWDEARKLALTCSGSVLQRQCDAALN